MNTQTPPQMGNETRKSILPSDVPDSIGFLGSPYNPSDELLTPAAIGVTTGDNISNVIDAVKGVAYYVDMIGFGEPSNEFTRSMGVKPQPLGANYFMKSGMKCSNGADMYTYFEGIPKGDALGGKMKQALREMGLPGLRGLAPGMIEDTKSALNPIPVINTVFGKGYAHCVEVEKQVGDLRGRIKGDDTRDENGQYVKGQSWIDGSLPVQNCSFNSGLKCQKAWVKDKDIDRTEWENTPKTRNPDGSKKITEKFENFIYNPITISTLGVLCLIAYGTLKL
jgi:hypothetical protein